MADPNAPNGGSQPAPPTVRCGAMEVHRRMLQTVPGYREARDAIEDHAQRAGAFPFAGRTGCIKIPVVVHIVLKDPTWINDAQVQSQIDVLNADFRKKNADIGAVPSVFAPLAADAQVEFALAPYDPGGVATTGITRTVTTKDEFTTDDDVKFAASGGADAWPSNRFLNIWVCPQIKNFFGQLLAGYAQFPGGHADTDGVVIQYQAFGTRGTAMKPTNLGRTCTHEVGHWLNLLHIWGDDNMGCTGSDLVDDTPNQGGPNTGVPTFPHVSCGNGPNGDMFMNYMDDVDDNAMMMFTAGQVVRMRATLDGARGLIGVARPCGKGTAKEPPKELVKDPIKDAPKESPKEFGKETPKEPPKDISKEFTKDHPKDGPKDISKEITGDFAKSPAADSPPKSLLEPPADFQLQRGGGPNFPGAGGPLPFVLATGAGSGATRPEASALAIAYLQLLSHYARLRDAGQLDAAGLAAWHEAAAAYYRIISGA